MARDLPYLVADVEGRVVGYAYAGPYRPRSAYRFTLEDSIYLERAATGRGIGRQLLDALIEGTTALGYRQMLAVIGDSGNRASIALHARAGFREVGVMRDVGFKFGGWLDVVIMQRPSASAPRPCRPNGWPDRSCDASPDACGTRLAWIFRYLTPLFRPRACIRPDRG